MKIITQIMYYLTCVGIIINANVVMIKDKIFLLTHKDFVSMYSDQGRKRIRDYKDSIEDIPIRLACNLLLHDSQYAVSLMNNSNYDREEVRSAFKLMREVKRIVKVR